MLAGYQYDRKLMSERRLPASEEKYHALVENLDGINIVDREGSFILVNQEYCRMLGYRAEELNRQELSAHPPWERKGSAYEAFQEGHQ